MKKVGLIYLVLLFSIQLVAQDSLNMKLVGLLDGLGIEYSDVWGYRHGTKEFAVIGSNSAINVVDVTDCANPTLVHQWVDGSSVIWRDFKDYGDYIYGVCDGGACQEGLQVINKNSYAQSQSLAHFKDAHNIFIDKNSGRLYVPWSNTNPHGLLIYDIKTDPSNPTLIKNINFRDVLNDQGGEYRVHDLYVENDTAYCSHGHTGYIIWDLTDVNNPTVIGELDDSNGYNHSSWRHPSAPYMYVAEETTGKEIKVYDISDITNPFTTYSFSDPLEAPTHINSLAHNPYAVRDRLYISFYEDGIQVYDTSDPELPERIAYYDTYLDNNGNGYNGYNGAWGVYPFLPSGCILASDISYGLNTLELTITPDTDNTMPSDDIIIDNSDRGIVFRTPEDEYVRVILNNQMKLDTIQLASAPTDRIEFRNSNLKFTDAANGIIIKNPNGDYTKLGIDDGGTIVLDPVTTLPSNAIKLTDEDICFTSIRAGVKMKSIGGSCYIYILGDNGVEKINSIDCD